MSPTLVPEELAARGRRHVEGAFRPGVCVRCGWPWPCDASALLRELDRLQSENWRLIAAMEGATNLLLENNVRHRAAIVALEVLR